MSAVHLDTGAGGRRSRPSRSAPYTPMDFADATLVLAAENFGVAKIATLDQRGFRTFRFGRGNPFQLVLQDL